MFCLIRDPLINFTKAWHEEEEGAGLILEAARQFSHLLAVGAEAMAFLVLGLSLHIPVGDDASQGPQGVSKVIYAQVRPPWDPGLGTRPGQATWPEAASSSATATHRW